MAVVEEAGAGAPHEIDVAFDVAVADVGLAVDLERVLEAVEIDVGEDEHGQSCEPLKMMASACVPPCGVVLWMVRLAMVRSLHVMGEEHRRGDRRRRFVWRRW